MKKREKGRIHYTLTIQRCMRHFLHSLCIAANENLGAKFNLSWGRAFSRAEEHSIPAPMSKPNQSTSASAIAKQVLKHTPQLPELPPKRTTSAIESAAATRPKGTQPVRSTKTSQKLVLFPPRSVEPNIPLHGKSPFAGAAGADDEYREREHDQVAYETERWRTEDHHHHQQRQHVIPQPSEWPFVDRTAAEHMTQDERDMANLPRVAAYCTGEGYQLDRLKTFLRQHHHVTPRLYDECLYAAYHYPLLTLRPGKENLFNVRVRSSSPRPQSISDNEELDIDEDTYQQDDAKVPSMSSSQKRRPYSRRASHGNIREEEGQQEQQQQQQQERYYDGEEENEADHQSRRASAPSMGPFRTGFDTDIMVADKQDNVANGHQELEAPQPNEYYETLSAPTTPLADTNTMPPAPPAPMTPREDKESPSAHRPPFMGGEVFIFDYGVVVFWNFQRAQELLMLEDLAEFSIAPFRDNPDEDMQIEEMHFQYDTSQVKPRIFNDMITLKTHNHMIKLTISHGLSQSAVLARYEDIMDKTIEVRSADVRMFNYCTVTNIYVGYETSTERNGGNRTTG